MSDEWICLADDAAWYRWKTSVAQAARNSGNGYRDEPPDSYPCLVTTIVEYAYGDETVGPIFVYADDARRLLAATGGALRYPFEPAGDGVEVCIPVGYENGAESFTLDEAEAHAADLLAYAAARRSR